MKRNMMTTGRQRSLQQRETITFFNIMSTLSTNLNMERRKSFSKIIQRQRDYFYTGETVPVSYRKLRLAKLKQLIEENMTQLTDAVYKDLKKLPGYTEMELTYTVQEIDYVINHLDLWTATETPSKTLLNCLDQPIITKQPLGVVLIIGPWNYPLDMIIRPLIPALAAGNTVIVKPSELATNTATAISDIFSQYFPPELVTVVNGGTEETTMLLKERFDHIFYTGSTSVGKVVMTAAAKHLTPVTLELGGKCPTVILSDAKIDVTATRIAWGKWTNCGQTCVAPDYVLVTSDIKEYFVEELKDSLKAFYGKNVISSADYGRIINKRHFERLSKLLSETGGKVLFSGGHSDPEQLFVPPTIIEVAKDDVLMKDEIFGPILPLITVADLTEAIQLINSKERPLAAYLFTTSSLNSERFVKETCSGGVCINDVVIHILVDTLPFGGVGQSGMGRYHGKYGFDTFTHEKPILKRGFFGESLMSVRYPPLTEEKMRLFRALVVRRRFPRFLQWVGRIPYLFWD